MQPIPESVLMRFNALMDKKSVPSSVHEDYRKWLRYYLDFRVKYPLPDDRSGQVRLFIEKMRSKGQSGKSLNHAAHALSLFFSLQTKKRMLRVVLKCGWKNRLCLPRYRPWPVSSLHRLQLWQKCLPKMPYH